MFANFMLVALALVSLWATAMTIYAVRLERRVDELEELFQIFRYQWIDFRQEYDQATNRAMEVLNMSRVTGATPESIHTLFKGYR